MNPEISKLEAALLNLDEARLPLISKINEYNSLAAAETSRRLACLPGAEKVIARAIPAIYSRIMIGEEISIDYAGNEKIDLKKMEEIASKVQNEYIPIKSPIIEKLRGIALKEDILQKELCEHTNIIPIREDHPHSHAYLLVVREEFIYIANVKYLNGQIIKRLPVPPNQLSMLKEQIDCNKFEVSHPSRLAEPAYMASAAGRQVFKKARAKQL